MKSRNASAAVFAASACSSVVSNSYIFTIACDQSRRSRCRSTGHSEPLADERDREGLREVGRRSKLPRSTSGSSRVRASCEAGSRIASTLPGRERCGQELANSRVVGRLEPEQAPALHLPESRPARIERLILELGVGSDMPVVPSETPVTKACANVGVAGNEPPGWADFPRGGARASSRGARRASDTGRPGMQVPAGQTPRPTPASRRTGAGRTTPSATSADAAMQRPMIPSDAAAAAVRAPLPRFACEATAAVRHARPPREQRARHERRRQLRPESRSPAWRRS